MTTYDLERQAVADEYLGGDTDKADAVMESLPYTPDLSWDDVARAIEAVLHAAHGHGGATDPTETRVTSSTGGQKGTKLARYDLIPARPLRLLAEHYGKGAEKYDDHNWRKGYDWSLSFAALMRHAWAFWNGEDNDAETGRPHMAAVAFHAFALLEFMHEHPDFDDRWKPNDLASHPENEGQEETA